MLKKIPLGAYIIAILTLIILLILEYVKLNVSLFDLMHFFGFISEEEVLRYKTLESSAIAPSQEWTPTDIISLIGTIGQLVVGLVGSFITYLIAVRHKV